MISSSRQSHLKSRCVRAVALTLSCVLGVGSTGLAQTDDLTAPLPRVRSAMARSAHSGLLHIRNTDLLKAVADSNTSQLDLIDPAPNGARSQRRVPSAPPSHRGSRARQVTGGIIGAVLGMWAGAVLGGALEGDSCACDSPGLKGALIGAPVGGTIGAVLGVFLAGK